MKKYLRFRTIKSKSSPFSAYSITKYNDLTSSIIFSRIDEFVSKQTVVVGGEKKVSQTRFYPSSNKQNF